jgi:predicted permease
VTASLFDVLQVAPALGRPFREDEETVGREFVVILSDRLWARRFNRDPAIVNRSISLNGQPHVVVGVMPEGFAFPGREFELWTPLTVDPDDYRTRMGYNFLAFGRLRPGVGVDEAQAELDGIARRLAERFPETNDGIGVLVAPMLADLTRTVRAPLQVLLGGVLLLLLVGCTSLATLFVTRSVARSGELVLRSTLGAGRNRLVRQAVTELVPLVALGGPAGLLIAVLLLRALVPWLPASLPRVEAIAVNVPVVLFAIVALAMTMVAAGVWPALQVGRWDLASALRESLRGAATTRRGTRLRDGLVVGQVALAVVLSVASVLLARSFINLLRIDPGFRTEGIATVHLAIPRSSYPLDREVAAFCQAVLGRVTRVSGVTSAGMVNRLPLAGGAQVGMLELDRSVLPSNRLESVDWRTVTPDYFRTLGIPLLAGRFFTDADREDAAMVGLVDERLARAAWPNENPIGRRFRIPPIAGLDPALFPWVTVVGVVGHIQHDGLAVDQRPQVYWNYLQRAQDRMALVVRTSGDAESSLPALVAAVRDVDPDQPVYDMRTMTEVVSRSVAQPWLTMVVLAAFAIAALVMAAVGVYGVIAYAVRQREIEFGVRMALGATAGDVLLLVCRRGGALVGLGLAIGPAGAILASYLFSDLVYGVSRTDTASFLIALAVLAATALLAVILPASRVARCRPASVLRA